MSNRSRRKRRQQQRQASARRLRWALLAGGGLAVAILLILLVAQPWSGDDPQVTPQVAGSPRLMVEQAVIDEGYIRYNVPVRTTFRLSNVGDQPLQILDTPQVRLAEGC